MDFRAFHGDALELHAGRKRPEVEHLMYSFASARSLPPVPQARHQCCSDRFCGKRGSLFPSCLPFMAGAGSPCLQKRGRRDSDGLQAQVALPPGETCPAACRRTRSRPWRHLLHEDAVAHGHDADDRRGRGAFFVLQGRLLSRGDIEGLPEHGHGRFQFLPAREADAPIPGVPVSLAGHVFAATRARPRLPARLLASRSLPRLSCTLPSAPSAPASALR